MKINILIPTYNRAHFVQLQILNMLNIRSALALIGVDLHVIISDNHSSPPVTVPEAYKNFITLIKPPEHLNSGEENVVFALDHCDGEYIWTLGDDDAPIQTNVVSLFETILDKKPDFIVAGSSAFLGNGKIIHSQTLCSEANQILTLPDFVSRTGIWFVLTGFSGLIIRREKVQNNIERFSHYFSASKIYSYAMFLFETFWDCKFIFFNQPIVLAAQNIYGDNWYRMAIMENVFHRFFWTTGFIRQLQILRQARSIPIGYYATIIDQRIDSRFSLIYQICTDTMGQLLEDITPTKYTSRKMTQQEFDEIVNFLCLEEPRMMLLLAPLIQNHDKNKITRRQVRETIAQLGNFVNTFYLSYYIKTYCGWNIYYFDNVFRAIQKDAEKDMMPQLNDIAPTPSQWQPLSRSIDELEQKLKMRPYPTYFSKDRAYEKRLSIKRRLLNSVIELIISTVQKARRSRLGSQLINYVKNRW